MEVEVKIKGLMIDPISNLPIIILKDEGSDNVLPIWVGIFEANAIALQIEKIGTPRPMTHDLIKNLLETLSAQVDKIVITELKDSTFFALIHLNVQGNIIEVDSRPSDAIAIALRAEAPIYVDEDVISKAKKIDLKEAGESERLKKWLENLDPDDLGTTQ
jgi:bifunctional DNase/RNase